MEQRTQALAPRKSICFVYKQGTCYLCLLVLHPITKAEDSRNISRLIYLSFHLLKYTFHASRSHHFTHIITLSPFTFTLTSDLHIFFEKLYSINHTLLTFNTSQYAFCLRCRWCCWIFDRFVNPFQADPISSELTCISSSPSQ